MWALRESIDALGWIAAPLAPFSDKGMVYWALGNRAGSVLSIGCGNGEKDEHIVRRRKPHLLVGLDIFEPCLRACQRTSVHDGLVLGDARRLPFRDRSFDVVVAAEVIEHLEKDDASELLREMERVARKKIIISCPVGYVDQGEYDGNPFQLHRSGFTPAEFRRRGYSVRGAGLRWVWYGGRVGLLRSLAVGFTSLLPISYSIPELGGAMVCVRLLAE